MTTAITRQLSPAITRCELTHLDRQPIDFDRACTQHEQYVDVLRSLDCEVIALPGEPDLPDAVFVEDTAIVLDELAVITRPGAASRRGELPSIERTLAPFRRLAHIEPPATLDGGDVITIGRRLFVGLSQRTNAAAIEQLRTLLAPHDYHVDPAPVRGCLHLKTACTALDDDTLLIHRPWTDESCFDGFRLVDVDARETNAANVVRVSNTVLAASHGPRTIAMLRDRGYHVIPVDADELAKAEGGLTCCSLIIA